MKIMKPEKLKRTLTESTEKLTESKTSDVPRVNLAKKVTEFVSYVCLMLLVCGSCFVLGYIRCLNDHPTIQKEIYEKELPELLYTEDIQVEPMTMTVEPDNSVVVIEKEDLIIEEPKQEPSVFITTKPVTYTVPVEVDPYVPPKHKRSTRTRPKGATSRASRSWRIK